MILLGDPVVRKVHEATSEISVAKLHAPALPLGGRCYIGSGHSQTSLPCVELNPKLLHPYGVQCRLSTDLWQVAEAV